MSKRVGFDVRENLAGSSLFDLEHRFYAEYG